MEILRKDMNNQNNKVCFSVDILNRYIPHRNRNRYNCSSNIDIILDRWGLMGSEACCLNGWRSVKGYCWPKHPYPHPPWRQIYVRLYGRRNRIWSGIRRALHEFRTCTSYFVRNVCLKRKNWGRFCEENVWFCKSSIRYHFLHPIWIINKYQISIFIVAPCKLIILYPLFVQLIHTQIILNIVELLKTSKTTVIAPT